MGAWLSPVVLAALGARVVAGDADTPTLVAMIVVAGLVGLLAAGRPIAAPSRATLLPLLAVVVLVLAANLAVLGDVARWLGFARVAGIAAGAALALAVAAWAAGDRVWRLATPMGAAVLLLPLALVIAAAGAPWLAWTTVASRPALTFGPKSVWVTQGRAVSEGMALTFDEPHRVIAATAATWRVVERDAARVAVREWRLHAGDGLTLRPGDGLAVDAGARVRFQAGRRVPGAPSSGVAWADGRPRRMRETLMASAGAAVTLVVGGLALAPAVPVAGASAVIGPAALLAFVVGATLWGLYGIAFAPELALVPRALAPVVEVLTRITTPRWRDAVLGLVLSGVIVLFVGVALACRARLTSIFTAIAVALERPAPSATALAAGTAAVVTAAALVAARGSDPWQLFAWGLGLGAAAAIAPRLARAGARGELAGAVVGTVVFAAVVFGAGRLPPGAGALVDCPAVVAAPLAWVAARLARVRP